MKTLHVATLAIFAALSIQAAPITTITNYFAGYVFVTNGWSTAEDSGLSNGTAYIAIPLASLPALAASNAVASGAGSDVRMLLYAFNDAANTSYQATVATNRPANTTITRATISTTATGYSIGHSIISKWTFPTTSAYLTPE